MTQVREPRPMGLAAQPALRLALGYQDEAKRGAPVKTNYFVAKEGRDGEYAAAARKFREVYGDQPRAIDIMLPASITQALDVRYKAFYGVKDERGGSVDGGLSAIGELNFAQLGVMGGPDTLNVWRQDGAVEAVDITGPDDPICEELGVALYTTFRFGIPNVLGAAGVCEITSKGKKTTDNLFERLVTIYSWFGARTPFVVRPKLVLRPATGRPVVKGKRIKSSFYAVDIYVPESVDEMVGRFANQMQALPGGSAAAAMYGQLPAAPPDRPAIEAVARSLTAAPQSDTAPEPPDEVAAIGGEGTPGARGQQGEEATEAPAPLVAAEPTGPASSPPDDAPPAIEEPWQPPKGARAIAARIKELEAISIPEVAGMTGKTLAGIGAMTDPEKQKGWIQWGLGDTPNAIALGEDFRQALREYAQLKLPELWAELTDDDGQMRLSA